MHGNQILVATVLVLYAYRTQQIVRTKNTGSGDNFRDKCCRKVTTQIHIFDEQILDETNRKEIMTHTCKHLRPL